MSRLRQNAGGACHPSSRRFSEDSGIGMTLITILILAVVQGLTEFLPVSSSGHLVVAQSLFQALGWGTVPDKLEVNIVLHLGTLASVLIYYWSDIARLMSSDRRVLPLLIVGTIPAGVVGVGLKQLATEQFRDQLFENALLVGFLFPATAVLLVSGTRHRCGDRMYGQLDYRGALMIGLFQALAILPGISRSGATIVAGLLMGLRRDAAATFAFLLAIPAIAGAGLLEFIETDGPSSAGPASGILVAGLLASTAVGLAALSLLNHFLRRGRLAIFAWYLVPLGIAVVLWQSLS